MLVLLSVLQSPVAYFAAGGYGDWALAGDVLIRYLDSFVSVDDSAYLGDYSGAGSILAACGYTHLEARQQSGLLHTTTDFWLRSRDGKLRRHNELDVTASVRKANDDMKERLLREWDAFCDSGDDKP